MGPRVFYTFNGFDSNGETMELSLFSFGRILTVIGLNQYWVGM
jgi:hypothetical protein